MYKIGFLLMLGINVFLLGYTFSIHKDGNVINKTILGHQAENKKITNTFKLKNKRIEASKKAAPSIDRNELIQLVQEREVWFRISDLHDKYTYLYSVAEMSEDEELTLSLLILKNTLLLDSVDSIGASYSYRELDTGSLKEDLNNNFDSVFTNEVLQFIAEEKIYTFTQQFPFMINTNDRKNLVGELHKFLKARIDKFDPFGDDVVNSIISSHNPYAIVLPTDNPILESSLDDPFVESTFREDPFYDSSRVAPDPFEQEYTQQEIEAIESERKAFLQDIISIFKANVNDFNEERKQELISVLHML